MRSPLSEPLPYYKWLWRDHRASRKVQRMCWQAEGLHRALLDEFWATGPLPDDPAELAYICRCPVEDLTRLWPQIAACWQSTEEGLINEKLNSLRTEKDQERIKRQVSGKKGGIAKMVASAKQVPSTCHIAGALAEQEHKQSGTVASAKQVPEFRLTGMDVALGVKQTLALGGERILGVLKDVANGELSNGRDATELRDAMISAGEDYKANKHKLDKYAVNIETYYALGDWKIGRASWKYKEGQEPKPKAQNTGTIGRKTQEGVA